ncbi:MAG TPA: SpoIIE family protein phosphatase [Pseudonocardiaceae bacterium]
MAPSVTDPGTDERLRQIHAVTDGVLAQLDLQTLLTESLARVRDLLRVDAVAVLLLDATGQWLLPAATSGTESHHGARLPLSAGFAGRIAEEKRPVIIDELSDGLAGAAPWTAGVHSLLGVPLLADGELTGILHVATRTPRRFTEDDATVLQQVADRIALVARAQHSHAERTAAAILQRSLLPIPPATVLGLDLATRYVSGGMGSVGGDWYDLFTLPSGQLGIVIGDVTGNGLRAAVVMGRLRSALRAYALDYTDPADVLTRLDRKVQHFEPEIMATVIFGCYDPAFHLLRFSLAGHPPPVLALPGQPATVLDLPADPPLGARSRRPRRTTTVEVPPGALVCLYTDGLIERRNRSLDDGLDILRRAVVAGPAETVCATIMRELVGSDAPADDIAVLVLRSDQRDDLLELEFPATPDSLTKVRGTVVRWLSAIGGTTEEIGDVVLAVHEACSNVVEHAYGPTGGQIHLRLVKRPPDVVVTVRDTGTWRPPRGTHRGRGKHLMKGCSDELQIDHGPEGTVVTIRRHLAGQEEGS